jgi:integrase
VFPLADYVESIWLPEVLATVKYSTGKLYRYMTRVHLIPAFGNTQLRLITRDAVQSFLMAKLHSGLSWKTVKHMWTVFGTVMGAAEIAELIPSNPVRKTRFSRRGIVKEKPAIAPEKIRELLEALPEPSSSLARLLVFTGFRIGELLALRWQDIDLEHGVLRVRRTVYDGHFDEPKTQRSKRTVPLRLKFFEILTARKPNIVNPDALVFPTKAGTAFDRHNLVNQQFKPTCKRLGLVGVTRH